MEFPEHRSPVAPRHRPMCHSLCRHLHPSADLVPSQLGSAPAELALVLPAHRHHRIYGEKVSKQGLELTHAMETKYVDAQVPPVPPNHPGFVLQPQRPQKRGDPKTGEVARPHRGDSTMHQGRCLLSTACSHCVIPTPHVSVLA